MSAPSLEEKDEDDDDFAYDVPESKKGGKQVSDENKKVYVSVIDNLVERGARHMKGQILKVPVDEARANTLITHSFIARREDYQDVITDTTGQGLSRESLTKAEEKPEHDRAMKPGDVEKKDEKGAEGKGADLLKGKEDKKDKKAKKGKK